MTSLALAARPLEFFVAQYRRVWRGTVISSAVTPVVYLLALGWGLGQLVNDVTVYGQTYTYLEFVAPGLLAATAMQVASFESSWPVLNAIKWSRQYHAMLSTPLRVRDIVLGHQTFVAARVFTTSIVYLVVITAFGAVKSPLAILAVPAATLVGLAFSAPVAAWGAKTESDASFVAIFRFVILPMFLFSGTFVPISKMPTVVQVVAYVTPLWHGVNLCRQLTLGVLTWSAAGDVAFLVVWSAIGLYLALLAYRRRLVL